jgi:hypothetical protein
LRSRRNVTRQTPSLPSTLSEPSTPPSNFNNVHRALVNPLLEMAEPEMIHWDLKVHATLRGPQGLCFCFLVPSNYCSFPALDSDFISCRLIVWTLESNHCCSIFQIEPSCFLPFLTFVHLQSFPAWLLLIIPGPLGFYWFKQYFNLIKERCWWQGL